MKYEKSFINIENNGFDGDGTFHKLDISYTEYFINMTFFVKTFHRMNIS